MGSTQDNIDVVMDGTDPFIRIRNEWGALMSIIPGDDSEIAISVLEATSRHPHSTIHLNAIEVDALIDFLINVTRS